MAQVQTKHEDCEITTSSRLIRNIISCTSHPVHHIRHITSGTSHPAHPVVWYSFNHARSPISPSTLFINHCKNRLGFHEMSNKYSNDLFHFSESSWLLHRRSDRCLTSTGRTCPRSVSSVWTISLHSSCKCKPDSLLQRQHSTWSIRHCSTTRNWSWWSHHLWNGNI